MKQVTRIEMANDNDIYSVTFGKEISIITDEEGRYIVTDDGKEEGELFWSLSFDEAKDFLQKEAVDENLIVKGYGVNSCLKFWKLPEKIKSEIFKMAVA